ncbi:hypothetical protein KVG88_03315 [Pseudomonas sp. SWRI74]|uniref:Uncharacterized protein n=1 Tax=Pseudomonas azerbaijanoccidentalis TaxID=2842347 RepID=A0ABS6QJF3_9PSED|nr:hypothetical protein [Pseudomonas azerbaijanoccidentalis]MBV4519077.1 hypothetical protein [Pseudomonas azerbaijanoccidentalis]MCK8663368.1 hypothetical protein [Pseudomonas azerbaijanoccidentalis]
MSMENSQNHRRIASILGGEKLAIVLIPNENALTKLAKGHQADETLV